MTLAATPEILLEARGCVRAHLGLQEEALPWTEGAFSRPSVHPVQSRKALQGQRSGRQDGPACWRQGKEARAAVSEAPEVPRSEGGSLGPKVRRASFQAQVSQGQVTLGKSCQPPGLMLSPGKREQ